MVLVCIQYVKKCVVCDGNDCKYVLIGGHLLDAMKRCPNRQIPEYRVCFYSAEVLHYSKHKCIHVSVYSCMYTSVLYVLAIECTSICTSVYSNNVCMY